MKEIYHTKGQYHKIKKLLRHLIHKTNNEEILWYGGVFMDEDMYCHYNNSKIMIFIPNQRYGIFNEIEQWHGMSINDKMIIRFDNMRGWRAETELGRIFVELMNAIHYARNPNLEKEELSKNGEEELDNLYKTILIEDIADI